MRRVERLSDNPIRGKERSRVGEADPAMRENRQVFPHTLADDLVAAGGGGRWIVSGDEPGTS
jgi:hypothetical protein